VSSAVHDENDLNDEHSDGTQKHNTALLLLLVLLLLCCCVPYIVPVR